MKNIYQNMLVKLMNKGLNCLDVIEYSNRIENKKNQYPIAISKLVKKQVVKLYRLHISKRRLSNK